jgi:hypothetical protein
LITYFIDPSVACLSPPALPDGSNLANLQIRQEAGEVPYVQARAIAAYHSISMQAGKKRSFRMTLKYIFLIPN